MVELSFCPMYVCLSCERTESGLTFSLLYGSCCSVFVVCYIASDWIDVLDVRERPAGFHLQGGMGKDFQVVSAASIAFMSDSGLGDSAIAETSMPLCDAK